MTLTTRRREQISAVSLTVSLLLSTFAFAEKTQEPWSQTAVLELAEGDVVGPMRFSPDGNKAVAAVRDANGAYSARVWSTVTGLELVTLQNPYERMLEYEFAPTDGDTIFAHTDANLRAWSADTGAVTSDFALDTEFATNDVAFFKDHFLAAKQIGGVEFWSAKGAVASRNGLDTLRPYQEITMSQSGMVYLKSAAYTVHLDLAGFDPAENDLNEVDGSFGPYELFLASTVSGDLIATYPEVADAGLWVAPVPTVRIRDDVPSVTPESPVMTEITGFEGEITTAQFSRDETRLLTLSDTGMVSFWNVADGSLITEVFNPINPITGAVLTSPDQALLSYTSGVSRVFDVTADTTMQEMPAPASSVALSPDRQRMITYGVDMAAPRVWQRISD